jgi:hypothetical protein
MPASLVFFIATAVVFALQALPVTGIFLMFAMAMFWSVALVNLGMIGVALEAASGRVARSWILLPLGFYGGYWTLAALDHATLRRLGQAYDLANASVTTDFDTGRQALVFDQDGSGAWLTQNFALPVAYTVNANFPKGFLSHRMMESAVCAKVRQNPTLNASFVHAFGFHDGEGMSGRRMEKRFCALSMPEKPDVALVRVSRQETKTREGTLPLTRVTTTIQMPDARRFELLGGVAAPLSWWPMPMMGCGLNSGAPSWDCTAGFWRNGFTPVVPGLTRYNRDMTALARTLGLRPVTVDERVGADPGLVLRKIADIEQATLARQLASIDAMIADPLAKLIDWQVGVVANSPEALSSRADAMMTGVERAAAVEGRDRSKAREGGCILARLLAQLPPERIIEFGPRLLALFTRADETHWLWEAEPLIRRIGDLGPDALPHLVNPRASLPSVNAAGVEGLCRVGAPGREVAGPVLAGMWTASERAFDHTRRTALFVAMRRMGVTPPPVPEEMRKRVTDLEEEWADISPESPPRVCAVYAERQARREEKYSGRRRSNLE